MFVAFCDIVITTVEISLPVMVVYCQYSLCGVVELGQRHFPSEFDDG